MIEFGTPTYYIENMGRADISNQSPRLLLQKLPIFPALNWLTFLFDLYRALRLWFNHQRREGMYEILDYDSTLELLDPEGKTAILKKKQRVKFLQDNVIAFQDYAWGDGETLVDFKCSPGEAVDQYQEGDRWNILISLRETKNSGDIEDFYIERKLKNTFTKNKEWRQVEIRHKTRRLKIEIVFPKERRCKRAILVERSRNRSTILGQEHFTERPGERQVLTWETTKIPRFEIYTIRWKW